MKPLLFALMSVGLFVESASAQVYCFPVAPPPPPVYVAPTTVYYTPAPLWVAPIVEVWTPVSVVIEPLPAEVWKEVAHCDVYYNLNGIDYYVDVNGSHFRLGEVQSSLVANKFVEPFSSFTGNRVARQLNDVPSGAEYRYQNGVKTVYVVDGRHYFATWVEIGDTIKTIWLRRSATKPVGKVEETKPIPDPAFDRGNGEYSPLQIPSEAQPAPVFEPPVLPPFDVDQSATEAEPKNVQPKRRRPSGPVARRV